MMAQEPELFKEEVYKTLRRHVAAINRLTARGMYFFDYGNAFLLEASRAGADILTPDGKFRYPSYVQDIMGPVSYTHLDVYKRQYQGDGAFHILLQHKAVKST